MLPSRLTIMRVIIAALLFSFALHGQTPRSALFNVVEATIPQMQDALAKKRVTSR